MEVILNINNLSYLNLFNDLSIYIEKNRIITISGSNNCGKTTLMRILNRDIKFKSSIILDGKSIHEYSDEEYNKKVQVVFPKQIIFNENTGIDEIKMQQEEIDKEKINYVLTGLDLKKISTKDIDTLTDKEIVLLQIAIAIINSEELIILDELDNYFTIEELHNLYNFLKKCIKMYDLTIITTCLALDTSIYADQLYIIDNGKIALKGDPLSVLIHDNKLNKIGLEIPFMIDLSVKLRDYDLISKVEQDKNKLIEFLWK